MTQDQTPQADNAASSDQVQLVTFWVGTEEFAVEILAEELGKALATIERGFHPDVKLTLVARTPGHPDRDIIMTRDDLSEVVKACERRNGDAHRS